MESKSSNDTYLNIIKIFIKLSQKLNIIEHGFKRRRSTSTAGLELQSEIARALDSNKFTLMASLDLSSAFDIVKLQKLIIIHYYNSSENIKIINVTSTVTLLLSIYVTTLPIL